MLFIEQSRPAPHFVLRFLLQGATHPVLMPPLTSSPLFFDLSLSVPLIITAAVCLWIPYVFPLLWISDGFFPAPLRAL
jgi:hypothetical protein